LKASPAYQEVPIDEEEWEQYRAKFEIPEGYTHPIQEVLNRYYAVKPESFTSPETGETDWQSFFESREQAISYADPETREIALEWAHRRDTPMVSEYRKAQETLRDYWALYDDVKKDHPEWAQVVEELERTKDSGRVSELRQSTEYRAFSREVTRRRQALRRHSPQLEAYLFFFGYITTMLNPKTAEILKDMAPGPTVRVSRLLSRRT
jgi:hypothetical protein